MLHKIDGKSNKFYVIQILENTDNQQLVLFTRWGKIGGIGSKDTKSVDKAQAPKLFMRKYGEKTREGYEDIFEDEEEEKEEKKEENKEEKKEEDEEMKDAKEEMNIEMALEMNMDIKDMDVDMKIEKKEEKVVEKKRRYKNPTNKAKNTRY